MWALLVGAITAVILWARWRRSGEEFHAYIVANAFALYGRLWHGCSVHGSLRLRPGEGALLIANHTCSADPALLQVGSTRVLSFLVAARFYANDFFRWLFNLFHCVSVARDGRDIVAARQALRRLKEGHVLVIFPEGNLSNYGRKCLRRGKCGPAYLALKSRAPVYPAFIARGPQSTDLVDSWLPSWMGPPRPHVYYGKPLDLSAYHGRPIDRKLLEQVTALFMSRIAALNPETRFAPALARLSSRR